MTSPASPTAQQTLEEVKSKLFEWVKKPAVIVGALVVGALALSSDGPDDDDDGSYDDDDDDDDGPDDFAYA